ncbi:hypothetical protein M409DRAFT_29856 [Zasmidium cellare ATCC 36951]|uniref:FAD-binding domain-containing protein n=1 Tax=Zasmidium cellare ATCC 36951 TaxID=1080233 RepID=A0A6A6BY05_ZASCE|nr:uncharacterized protein M409DRAFT_29856 [Zasmidium cellare ATCC 36951]KAF2159694.1 hypothetical protein M409DRAFT_29856 [Zasmidium cellare ATCC 36951]
MSSPKFPWTDSNPVIIMGAGFAGLALAQGLHVRKIPFLVFEQDELSTRPYGHRFRLDEAGIDALLETISPELGDLFEKTFPRLISKAPKIRDARTLEEMPLPSRPEPTGKGPLPIDRTWILQLLALGIEDKIHRGKTFLSYEILPSGVRVHFSDSISVTGCLLVGADGVRSKVRRQLQPDRKLLDMERQIIWGRTWITPRFAEEYSPEANTWLVALDQESRKNNVVLEPILWRDNMSKLSGGRLPDTEDYLYWAFATEAPESNAPRTPDELKAYISEHTKGWHLKFLPLFEYADWNLAVGTRIYSSKPDIGDVSNGKGSVILIGDSANPMTPQGGLGGSTAVQTAADLCRTLEKDGWSEENMAAFHERVKVLAKRSIEISFATNKIMTAGKDWQEFAEVER